MATFYNQATITYKNSTTRSNIVSGTIDGVVSATKEVIKETYVAGDTLTFIINIKNNKSSSIGDVVLEENLGEYLFTPSRFYQSGNRSDEEISLFPLTYVPDSAYAYIGSTKQGALTPDTTTPHLIFTNLTLPANNTLTIIYHAKLNEYAPLGVGGSVENKSIIRGDGLAVSAEASAIAYVYEGPALGITKKLSPSSVSENDRIYYTFEIINYGNKNAEPNENMVLRDTFNPILSNLEVKFNTTTLDPATGYYYNSATGEFYTRDNVIGVPKATISQNPTTGAWVITPSISTLTVSGVV